MLQAFLKACEVNKTTRKKKKSIGKVWQTFTPPRPLSLPLFAHPGAVVRSLSCWLACSMSTPLNGLKETSATCTEANFYLVIHVTSVDHSFNVNAKLVCLLIQAQLFTHSLFGLLAQCPPL